ncbi:MAG TPA: dipeptide/oligopeptide/nickel ABC transporter ATP-binding protein [Candidatus Acidoferrales bacterium]|nr:dipeptide/oligopeptide/nickel ABC transporter ATP-binding protein [Candidatus Acidoferrales bacterium]
MNAEHRGAAHNAAIALIAVTNLRKEFESRRVFGKALRVLAVDGVDLTLHQGDSFAVIGESGCGKTTLANCIADFEQPTSGSVAYLGREVREMSARERKQFRARVQIVCQDTVSSFNPRFTAREIVEEPLVIQGGTLKSARNAIVRNVLESVGLPFEWAERTADRFSGGQRQRLAIARALAPQPELLILDEALSGLDARTQSQIVALLETLRAEKQLSLLHIVHDLALLPSLAGEVAVMRRGRIIERGDARQVLNAPESPHTREMIAAQFWLCEHQGVA